MAKEDIKINKKFGVKKINITQLTTMDNDTQINEIKNVLIEAYPSSDILNSWIISCIELINKDNNRFIYLPRKLKVERVGNELVFEFEKMPKSTVIILILFISAFLVSSVSAAYLAAQKFNKSDVNIDIDKDGYSDINVDINNDKRSEINIDTDNDKKPDLNIDYKGNRKAIFNIDTNNDKKPDFNLVTKISSDKKCGINCDINDDGWPDINIDIDGDGKADLDIDTNGDNVADINIDTNGDGVCDYMCDTNNDGNCDKYCSLNNPTTSNSSTSFNPNKNNNSNKNNNNSNSNNNNSNNSVIIKPSGPSSVTGEPSTIITAGTLVITYDNNYEPITGVLPDDMKDYQGYFDIPERKFSVYNDSDYTAAYKLVWKINKNDFLTNNLQYKLTSTNGGAQVDFKTVPKDNGVIVQDISIPARATQTYNLSFKLVGTNQAQNEDKGREFNGIIIAEYN